MQDPQPHPTLPPLWPRLQSWEETRSLIPEKGPLEEDADVVVKGEHPPLAFRTPLAPQDPGDNVFACWSPSPSQAGCTASPEEEGPGPGCPRAGPGSCSPGTPWTSSAAAGRGRGASGASCSPACAQ